MSRLIMLYVHCHIVYKNPIDTSAYRLVYKQRCHLSAELKHTMYWPIKKFNFDIDLDDEKRMLQVNELDKFRLLVYENAKLYKEKTKIWHENYIKHREFEPGQVVLLFNLSLKLFLGKLTPR